tara:strand:+ start:1481 stop:1801 length:321 start_codon:yes stop_codon:yes gene_type:complete
MNEEQKTDIISSYRHNLRDYNSDGDIMRDRSASMTDAEILALYLSNDDGKFINEYAETNDRQWYDSDTFDFDEYIREKSFEFIVIPSVNPEKHTCSGHYVFRGEVQ